MPCIAMDRSGLPDVNSNFRRPTIIDTQPTQALGKPFHPHARGMTLGHEVLGRFRRDRRGGVLVVMALGLPMRAALAGGAVE
jgi:hypothetical protein